MTKPWLLVAPLLLVAFSGCLSDDSPDTDGNNGNPDAAAWLDDSHLNGGPRGFLPETVTGMDYLNTANANGTDGIWINDDILYASGPSGLRIIDVADPTNPILLAGDIADTGSRDVDIMVHPNGRLYATLSSGGVALVDVSDPEFAVVVNEVAVSSHNHGVVPNSTIVYNSRSISTHGVGTGEGEVTTGAIDIIDFADPENPVTKVFNFPAIIMDPTGLPKPIAATTCHDITFAMERSLAFCAGISETSIWDVSDAWNPEIVQVIDWPLVQIHHGVWAAHDGDMLILGDEFAGAAAGPNCLGPANPYATLWFFDISDLATPIPLGYFAVDYNSVAEANTALCTTHFGTLVEDRDMMVMGWYTAGVVLIDFSDPLLPVQVDHFRPDGAMNVWEARYYKGHVYTGDTARGVDVLAIV